MTTPYPDYLEHVQRLIAINNERYRAYSKASGKSADEDFLSLCRQNKERALHFNLQLIRSLAEHDIMPRLRDRSGAFFPASRNTAFGRWWRLGMQLPAKRINRATCRWWDRVALRAYRNVLGNLQSFPKELARVLRLQESILENDQRILRFAR